MAPTGAGISDTRPEANTIAGLTPVGLPQLAPTPGSASPVRSVIAERHYPGGGDETLAHGQGFPWGYGCVTGLARFNGRAQQAREILQGRSRRRRTSSWHSRWNLGRI